MIGLRRHSGPPLCIGHRGAAALAPENTLESLQLAIDLGCDLVEFDVCALADGRLVLANDRPRAGAELPTLDDALDFLGGTRAGVHIDLKTRGGEVEVARALRRHDLVERTLVSSFDPFALRAVAQVEPGVRLGFTYPQDRTGLTRQPAPGRVVRPFVDALKRALTDRVNGLLGVAGATVAVLHWKMISGPVVERCRALGTPVLAWTVDDAAVLRRLDELGVDGVMTNDPRIFAG